MLVDESLASYEVPHGLSWLIHVKVFGLAGWSGPTHIINVYLKLEGNFRCLWGECLGKIKRIIYRIIIHMPDAHFLILGDFNEESKKVMKHLNVTDEINGLMLAFIVGSTITCFPIRGGKKWALDHILLNNKAQSAFRNAQVYQKYNVSDHCPVVICPRKHLPPTRVTPTQTSWDNKMIHLKGDLVANDNSWTRLMTLAFEEDFLDKEHNIDKAKCLVSNQVDCFIKTFDQVCKKHSIKREHQPDSK